MTADYRLYHGDCLDIMPTLEAGSFDLIVTSPFYNCRKQYGNFDDQMPWPEYYSFMSRFLDESYRLLIDGGVIAINIPSVVRFQYDHKHSNSWSDYDSGYIGHRGSEKVNGRGRVEPVGFKIYAMMGERDSHLREPIIWVKGSREGEAVSTRYQMGSDNNPYMRPAHEFILLGSKTHWHHRGGTGRRGAEAVPFLDYTKDVWFVSPSSSQNHPATFPIDIPKRLINLFTHADDAVILDPFMGSGTTGEACLRTGRRFVGIEKEAEYFKIGQERMDRAKRELAAMLPGFQPTAEATV